MGKDFNRSFDQLTRGEQKKVRAALDRLRLRIEQGDDRYATWAGELYMPLEATCKKCGPDEESIVVAQVETKNSKIDDTEYVIGDVHLSTGRKALGAPVAYMVDIPFECQRAFMAEAAQLVVTRTWAAVAALVPAVGEATPPTPDEIASTGFGSYIERIGGVQGKRLI